MQTCVKCGFKCNELLENKMCEDCLYQYYCKHENQEYQPFEPENNVIEGLCCEDCGKELELESMEYGV